MSRSFPSRGQGSWFVRRGTLMTLTILSSLIFAGCRYSQFARYVEIVESTQDEHYVPLPVVFIPGIKGTELWLERPNERAKKLWGLSGHVAFFRGFDDLAFDYRILADGNAEQLAAHYRDRHIYPGDVLFSYGLGLQWITFHQAAVYKELRELLTEEGGFRAEKGPRGRSLFFLPYDWRLDNRIAAVKLAAALPGFRQEYSAFLKFWRCERFLKTPECRVEDVERPEVQADLSRYLARAQTNPTLYARSRDAEPQIRFNLIAHSMGGLVAQYFLAQLGGDEEVHRFITLGTPSRGAMDSLKAFAEGEYPETLWSNLLGGGFYPKRATNYITLSFPAVYQLLPRYAGAISGDLKAEDLGLTGPPGRIAGAAQEERMWAAYKNYRLLPDLEAVGVALWREPPKVEEAVLRRHLHAQLVSSACFHDAMDGVVDPMCKEDERKTEAIRFLESAYRDRSDADISAPALELLKTRVSGASRAPRKPVFGGRVVYGGHCHETITRAQFLKGNRIEFLGSRPDVNGETGDGAIHAGDGRVPVSSALVQRQNEKWHSSFFLCETHLGLVKNESFKYNLLRVLFDVGNTKR